MIVLNLLCETGHRFDGWFASSDAFRAQCEKGLVHCPHCDTAAVSQLPSAPRVLRGGSEPESPAPSAPAVSAPVAEMAQKLHQALTAMARQAENVGERFPEEARRMHYEEVPARAIRGVATPDETRELLEEGIAVLPAPTLPEGEIH